MRKITLFLLTCCFAMLSYGQDANKIKHGQVFEMFLTVHDVGEPYAGRNIKAVRIGEYFWLAESLDSPHRTVGSGGDWGEVLENESPIKPSVIEQYFTDNNLDKSRLGQFTNRFERIYGRHYNQNSVYGTWIHHNQHRNPMNWVTSFYNPADHEEKYPSGEIKDDPYMWTTPRLSHIQQLFAMAGFSDQNATGRLTGKDVRIDLAAKSGANDLAEDITLTGSNTKFSDWHSAATGRYNFNLMPAGQTLEKGTQIKNLFKDVTFAINYLADAMILRLGDEISYEKSDVFEAPDLPIPTPLTWVPAASKWSSVRMCRQLEPAELGYELYYNEDRQDIKKLAVDGDGNTIGDVQLGYEPLEHGYLRGFYAQYFIYETHRNPGYSVEDIIRFSKCVQDPLLPVPDCDCGAVYLTGHMRLEGNGGEEYSHNIFGSEDFTIEVPSTNPREVKIGFFGAKGNLISRVDGGVESDNMTYKCKLDIRNSNTPGTLQAYTVEYNPYGDDKITTIGRLLGNEASSHFVDHLNVRYYRKGVTLATAHLETFDTETFAGSVQSGHMMPNFTPEDPKSVESFVHAREQGEENIILIRLPLKAGMKIDDYTIALYDYDGHYICEIAHTSELLGGSNAEYKCYIPEKDREDKPLDGGFDGVLIPVLKSTINQNSPAKIHKESQTNSKVDRLPINVIGDDDWGWGFSATSAEVPIEELTLTISPNPVSDILQVSGNFEEALEVNIYSLAGGLMKKAKNTNSVDISHLPIGVYKVSVTTEKGYVAGTIIKK